MSADIITLPGAPPMTPSANLPEVSQTQAARPALRDYPMVEPSPAPEIFCRTLARVDVVAGMATLIFCNVARACQCEGEASLNSVVQAKLIMPVGDLPDILLQLARAADAADAV